MELRPRLRNAVHIHRQHYRNNIWYIIQDPANNQYYRLNPAAYHFVGMLDGQRTVAQVWKACNEELGDDAPTQGEAIQLLGQLYGANLIQAELPPDAESMFRRFQQRRTREVQGYLMNLLFLKLPLFDPDAFLNRWVSVFGRCFTWMGGVIWAIFVLTGLYFIAGRFDALWAEGKAASMFAPENLPWLYASTAIIKGLHEFGHAFACKRFGVKNGSGGEVHVMGIMFLIFTPLPYVDASSSWAFASKWQRAVVGMGGMLIELFLAAIAAIVWAQTAEGTLTHTIAYNIIFASGVSTLLFNANPLLRYDGYYILSDLLEIPNLWQRSREYMYYLVKKYVWGVKRVRNPAQTEGEKVWMMIHGFASLIYRTFVVAAILMYVASALPVVGLTLAAVAVAAWVCVPVGKFLHYLLVNQELMRCRSRAMVTTGGFALAVGILIGSIQMPEHVKTVGEVKQKSGQTLYRAETDGFLVSYLPTGSVIEPDKAGEVLVRMENPELLSQRQSADYEIVRLEASIRDAQDKGEFSAADGLQEQLAAAKKQIATLDQELGRLVLKAGHEGQWLAHPLDKMVNGFLHRGDVVGMLVGQKDPQIQVKITQEDASLVLCEACTSVELRLPGDPAKTFHGDISAVVPAGQKPQRDKEGQGQGQDAATANRTRYGAPRGGGQQGQEEEDPFFQVFIHPGADAPTLYAGQAVAVRFDLPHRTLASQWYHQLLQLLQKRFKY